MNFNGQINVSRDLRQNKQTVIGKYDGLDIIFLSVALFTSIITAYLLGFYFKIIDEFISVVVALIPLIVIISLGFRKTAGLRQFFYILMNLRYKKTKVRDNRIYEVSKRNKKADNRYLVMLRMKPKSINKYIKKCLKYENLDRLQVRWTKDKNKKLSEIHFVLELTYTKSESIMGDMLKKFLLNEEFTGISVEEIETCEKELENDKKVFMLNLYDKKIYKEFINKVKRYCDVISYYKRVGKKIYVNTFLLIDNEMRKGKKLTKEDKVLVKCSEYKVWVDELSKEQKSAKYAVSYLMTNKYNAYREWGK